MNNVCVLIPSYNEAKTIGGIVRDIKALGLPAYVVDDGSSDGTAAIARDAGAIVMKHEKNMGKGAALREGFRHALKKGYDAVMVIDGDGQHEVRSIPGFIKYAEETDHDIVIGNRVLEIAAMPYVRRKTNRFMSYLISRICGQEIPDSQCGYRLIRSKVLEAVSLESSNFEIESELIIKACRKGFHIGALPIRAVYQDEKSRINPIIDTLRFMAFMIKMSRTK